MTSEARLICFAIGRGYCLRIPHDGSPASLVSRWSDYGRPAGADPRLTRANFVEPPIEDLAPGPVRELLESGLLHKLTEHPIDQRAGWREIGLNGKLADFYLFIQ